MIALVVSLKVHEDKLDDFLTAIQENANRTFTEEAGCRYFDVDPGPRADPLHFIFYELYDDEAAVEAHRAAPHFADWRRAADECVVPGSQVNTLCNQLFPTRTRPDRSPGADDARTAQAQPVDHPVGGRAVRPR